MPIQLADERRLAPRFNVTASCTLLLDPSDAAERQPAILGYVKDLSRVAVAVLLPSHEVHGVNASSLGKSVGINLGLPVGSITLSATLIRYLPDSRGKHLVVFRIDESDQRQRYNEFVDSLRPA